MDKEEDIHLIELTTDMISAGWDDEAVPPPTPPKPAEIDVFETAQFGDPVLGSELEIMDTDKPEVPDGWTIIDDNEVTKDGDCYLTVDASPYVEPANTVCSELGKKASEAKATYNKYAPGSAIAIIRKKKPANKEPEQENPKPEPDAEWFELQMGDVVRKGDQLNANGNEKDLQGVGGWIECSPFNIGTVVGVHPHTKQFYVRRRMGTAQEVPIPHLPPPSDDNQSGKNLTRQLKCYCEESGYICRTTQKWLNKYGPPISPANNKPMKVEQKDDNNE